MKPRNPLDVIDTCKRYKCFETTSNQPAIKQEDTSNHEDDPSGSSGAEVKGDSDDELPTDKNE
jgi:predicted NBD/HSP70 family sugar kinase